MCIVFVAFEDHPVYSLVLASNRDEEQDRTAAPCGWWESNGPHAGVLAGRDLARGGTWLGVHPRRGVWAVLTNFREPNPSVGERSRGELPLRLLSSHAGSGRGMLSSSALHDDLDNLRNTADSYAGFNLLVGGAGELWWVSNRASSDGADPSAGRRAGSPRASGSKVYAEKLNPGMHAVSNASLDTPWPKLERGRALFRKILDANVARAEPPSAVSRRRLAVELLGQLLSDSERAPPSELPCTGLPLAAEAMLSSICVAQNPAERAKSGSGYGTVAQTVLLIGRDGYAMLAERRMRDGATLGVPSLFEFELARPPRGLVARATPSARARWALGLGIAFSVAACLGVALMRTRPSAGARR
ncbi:NRDE protein-domain-containing protein [Pavlovales sp. CCMP2436]|nr:NRDE protein-domain-containing protein [Pavlovales sp. CCMP2436]|mmetsp:Transcript_16367/g.37743  ORF Transcript_16367/g.37743 Transcript_16367/m.37743 type:complete len:359 (+) Transcript_16367:160-1236(+)